MPAEVKAWLPATEGKMFERLGLARPGEERNPNAFRRWVRTCTKRSIEEWPGAFWVVDKWNRRAAALVPATWQDGKATVQWSGEGLLLVSEREATNYIAQRREE